jgi:7-cyano-7-deazaguanine synthase
MNRAIVLLSGGMDSLVCAALAIKDNQEVGFLHLDYGQKTSAREKKAFINICDFYQIPENKRKIINVSFMKEIGGSSLTDDSISVKDYQGDSKVIPNSYVPFRNSIILSVATSWSEVFNADYLYIGANYEDSPGYPDCRPEYYEAFNQVIKLGTKDGKTEIKTPVIMMKKKEIVELGAKLKVPYELSWSCYRESQSACGNCDSCALRLRGFKEAGIIDPISYKN